MEAEGYGFKSQIKLIFRVCACERLIFHSTQSFFLHPALVIGGLDSCAVHASAQVSSVLIGGVMTLQYRLIQPNDDKRIHQLVKSDGKRNLTAWTGDRSIDSG